MDVCVASQASKSDFPSVELWSKWKLLNYKSVSLLKVHVYMCVCFLLTGMGSMPNLSIGLSSMSARSSMPILTPIAVNHSMHSVHTLVPTPMTLPLINCLVYPGLPNGNVNLLTPPLVPNSSGWFCGGTILIGSQGQMQRDIYKWISTHSF